MLQAKWQLFEITMLYGGFDSESVYIVWILEG